MFPTTDDGTWPGTWFIWTYSSSASGVTISLWNSTQCFQNSGWITWQTTPHATDLSQWAPPSSPTTTNSGNWSNGIMWKNVSNQSQYEYLRTTIPNSGNITAQPKSYLSGSKFDFQSGTIVGCGSTGGQAFAAYDALTGNLLWAKNTTDANTVPQAYYSAAGAGKLVFWNLVGDDWVVYNDRTGQELYRTDVTPGGPWNSYVTNPWIQDGNLYDYGYGGGVMSWNLTTGKVNWVCQTSTFNGGNVLGGGNPLRNAPVSSASVLYTANQIKTDFQPIWQNQGTYAINLTSGEQLWKLDIGPSGESSGGSGTHIGVAEGYLVTFGGYTNSWYVIGRGPSKTTVDATPEVTQGSPLVISGTVMDQSPAQPNTPCVSDASMEQWMEYLHLQKSEPTNTTGVPVTLTEFDSNNNQYTIGTTTSDASGTYAYTWTPTITGNYTIVATFAGSNSYGPSSAETHIYATATPASTAASTPTPNSVADTYFVPAIAGLFVAIIIIGVVLALLMLRKRP